MVRQKNTDGQEVSWEIPTAFNSHSENQRLPLTCIQAGSKLQLTRKEELELVQLDRRSCYNHCGARHDGTQGKTWLGSVGQWK